MLTPIRRFKMGKHCVSLEQILVNAGLTDEGTNKQLAQAIRSWIKERINKIPEGKTVYFNGTPEKLWITKPQVNEALGI